MRTGIFEGRLLRLVVLAVVAALVGAACGSDGDGGGDDSDGGSDGTSGDGSGRRAGSSECEFDDPAHGGTIIYGLESDTGNPWTPANAQMAIAGHTVAKTVFDTLTLLDEDGEPVPNLATEWTHDEDFTEWTFTIREGVRFHDGTELDGEAVAENLRRHMASFLTGKLVRDFDSVSAQGQTVTVTLERPFAQLAKIFSTQIGYVASPAWLEEVSEDSSKASEPVGTGPFRFESYTPGNGNSFVAECNPDYWREGFPRVDEVELRVLEDSQSRSNALISGEIDAMHTANADEIARFRERGDEFRNLELDELHETTYVLLNHTPEVKPAPGADTVDNPLADETVRRALAMATDRATLIDARYAGILEAANGPFPPGYAGHLDDTGYPAFDLEEARRLISEWEAEHGDLEINYATTSDPFNRVTAELMQEMWEEAGATVSIDTVEQTQFIGIALSGNFQAFLWRNHGRPDAVFEDIWWSSETAIPPPGISLNFGRISDEVVDENLAVLRESDDPEARREAAEAITRRFGEGAFNLWLVWTLWSTVAKPGLEDLVTGYTAPDGTPILQRGQGFVGAHHLAQAHWGS